VRLFMIATLMLSGVALLPNASAPWSSPVEQPAADIATEAPQGWNTITVDGGGSDRFLVRATVNGVELDFLIDSGASYIVLSPDAAAQAGYRASQLRFTGRASTANGDVRLAPVTLRELRIGQFSQSGVEAVVNAAPMPVSLLGMSFLSRLEGWETKGDRLKLYW
jgi:aspartyl protease family protein